MPKKLFIRIIITGFIIRSTIFFYLKLSVAKFMMHVKILSFKQILRNIQEQWNIYRRNQAPFFYLSVRE